METHTNNNGASNLRSLLSQDHARLERLFDELLCAFEGDAREQCAQLWTRFDTGLRAHFALEERYIMPRFKRFQPAEAAALEREHAAILVQLEGLGVGVDLHLTRADVVTEFVRAIQEHAAREDRLMYAWAEAASQDPEQHGWRFELVDAVHKLAGASKGGH